MQRCAWVPDNNPLDISYHDNEWGRPIRDDHQLFEMLTLEGAQAGLSWSTILAKREGYREAFVHFDPKKVSRFSDAKIEQLLQNPAIVRHRGKITATVNNAQAVLRIQKELGSFTDYIWSFVDGQPLQPKRRSLKDIPGQTPLSKAMSKDLLKRGFKFVGPTTCYAFMQAAGLVNDHEVGCFCYDQVR